MTDSLLKPQLEQQQAYADNEIASLRDQIKRDKAALKRNKADLTRFNAYKRELDEAMATLYPAAPRQWERVEDIPFGVPVTDKDGDVYRRNPVNGVWEIKDDYSPKVWETSIFSVRERDLFAPFIEVAEEIK